MTARAEVPEGCVGIDFPDGSKAHARELGGVVEVSDRQAKMIRTLNGDVKIVGTRMTVPAVGPWVDCAVCPRSFMRPTPDSTETRCSRCRGN